MRSVNDKCLLCKTNDSTKKNSHIFPRFITQSILEKDKKNRGFKFSSSSLDLPLEYAQSSDMMDYIFCPSCELFFSILERYFANKFHRIFWTEDSLKYFSNHNRDYLKVSEEIDHFICKLFMASILWRASIADSHSCSQFHLRKEEEERVRLFLLDAKRIKWKDFLRDIDIIRQHDIPMSFAIGVSKNYSDRTGNVIFLPPIACSPYYIMLAEYFLIFSFEPLSIDSSGIFNSDTREKVIVWVLSISFWNKLLKWLFNIFAEKAVRELRRKGKTPYFLK